MPSDETEQSVDDTEQKADYIGEDDEWLTANTVCPECTECVVSNGKINDCVGCDWWEVDTGSERDV